MVVVGVEEIEDLDPAKSETITPA
ncbi:hypothetical protein CCACVL1_04781 [Corchorus capsularis]|uniref:Uncharacterized protein n=1 Tax=Corchorus capsularis TaxID=210143 RepID=A0A1R3JPK7_COCAP|nr:hypothetical protein CCACVL1_04781 [Corchorus capsularis]